MPDFDSVLVRVWTNLGNASWNEKVNLSSIDNDKSIIYGGFCLYTNELTLNKLGSKPNV